jgi:hypothetical protein
LLLKCPVWPGLGESPHVFDVARREASHVQKCGF